MCDACVACLPDITARTTMPKPRKTAATRTQGKDGLTREDALVYLKRFPAQGITEVVINVVLVLIGNAVVLWLLLHGRLRAAHLIVLVMSETILLVAVAWVLQRLVPRRDWLEQAKPWREKIGIFAFMTVWLGGAYGITLAIVQGYGDVFALLHSPQAWVRAGLHWPLLYTFGFALVHGVGDMSYYKRHGGPFQSSVAHDAMARYLTLVLGAIPFAMPFFAATIGGFKGVEYVARKAKADPTKSIFAGAAMMAVFYGSFGLIELLMNGGVNGWAIGFVFAKLLAEVMVACIPLVMSKVARDGP
jgi:hypothetical protein